MSSPYKKPSLIMIKQKILYLDGVRGLASFIVVIHHFLLAFYPAHLTGNAHETNLGNGALELFFSKSPFNVFIGGNFAVCIFFVLSGYVLSYKLFEKSNDYILFYSIKRYFRLFLPVAFSILLAHLLLKLSFNYSGEVGIMAKSDWWFKSFWSGNPTTSFLFESLLYKVFFNQDTFYNTAIWSIGIELIGSYLLFIMLSINHLSRNNISLSILGMFLVFFIGDYPYYCCFFGGLIVKQLGENTNAKLRESLVKYSTLLFALGIYLGSFPISEQYQGYFYSQIHSIFKLKSPVGYHIFGSILFLGGLVFNENIQKIFSGKLLVFLGKISFSLYLLHSLVLVTWASFFFLFLNPKIGYHLAFLSSLASSIVLLLFLSDLMTKYIDEPSMKFSDTISNWIHSRILKLKNKENSNT